MHHDHLGGRAGDEWIRAPHDQITRRAPRASRVISMRVPARHGTDHHLLRRTWSDAGHRGGSADPDGGLHRTCRRRSLRHRVELDGLRLVGAWHRTRPRGGVQGRLRPDKGPHHAGDRHQRQGPPHDHRAGMCGVGSPWRRSTPTTLPPGWPTTPWDAGHGPQARQHPGASAPSVEFDYSVNADQPSRVKTTVQRAGNVTDASFGFTDGWGRTITTLTPLPVRSARPRPNAGWPDHRL